jgi:hypothetical protein
MKRLLRKLWIGVVALIVLNSACNLPAYTPTPQAAIPTLLPVTPTQTSLIPVTGMDNAASLQCQFCVNDEIHAVLLLAESATFLVSTPITGVNCLTAQVVNGRRIVICRGAQQTSFTLNICVDGSNCSQMPVSLETCPIVPQTGRVTQAAAPTVRVSPTPTFITMTPTIQFSLSTGIPTRIGVTRSPFTPTAATAFQLVTSTPAPPSGLQDPEGFVRWYFDTVWRQRNYQDLWSQYLTERYRANVGSGDFADYVGWWDSVERVDVQSVNVLQNDGVHAVVRVYAVFSMRDGRVVPSQAYDYDLFYDATRGTWMFDYRV